eukprot:CAMPEP_0117444822 /NCGR_PEP_ID=MMETSP0759-20121206/5456_1 /TAXON_ID=63605 /ORGANISM="Percolomonas cosmopolitus, Strain WS" /LENGTH=563 /DNA_ID=CAMNT_0005236935 /DNA_START=476 /DNA_END=2167 /DNA_ORIENTATION=-
MVWMVFIGLDVMNVTYGGSMEEASTFSTQEQQQFQQFLLPSAAEARFIHSPPSSLPFKIIYYSLFSISLFHIFITLPFAYFFHEAGDSEIPLRKRIFSALKYCVLGLGALLLLCIVSLIISFFPTNIAEKDRQIDHWQERFTEMDSYGVNAVAFLVGSVACFLGLVPLVIFLGCGLGAMPLAILGRLPNRVSMYLDNISEEQDIVQERMSVLRTKRNMGKRLSKREEKEFGKLQEKRSLLKDKENALVKQKEMGTARRVLQMLSLLIRFPLSVVVLLICLVLLISLMASSVHRLIVSNLGLFTGFTAPSVFEVHVKDSFYLLLNPLDFILVMSSWVFPLDYVLFLLLLTFFVWIVLGTIQMFWRSIWKLICLNCAPIRWRRTNPQSMLLRSVVFMFAMLALFFVLFSFAPQYLSFGSQQYYDFSHEEWRFCNIGQLKRTNDTLPQPGQNESNWRALVGSGEADIATTERTAETLSTFSFADSQYEPQQFRPCYMTEIATLVHNVSIRTWGLFGILLFGCNFVLVVFSLLGLLVSIFRLRPKPPGEETDDADADDWEENYEVIQ